MGSSPAQITGTLLVVAALVTLGLLTPRNTPEAGRRTPESASRTPRPDGRTSESARRAPGPWPVAAAALAASLAFRLLPHT